MKTLAENFLDGFSTRPKRLYSICVLLPSLASVLASTPAIAQSFATGLTRGDTERPAGRQSVAISPQLQPGQIIVSFGDRRLYHIIAKGRAESYPIAVPRQNARWAGTSYVSMKRENPSWTPTAEMRRENPRLPSWVPGGHPMNPLGVRALYLGSTTYRIHGTDAPWTVGDAVSAGCIRMFNEDVTYLYPRVPVGTPVTVTWKRYKTTAIPMEQAHFSDESDRTRVEIP